MRLSPGEFFVALAVATGAAVLVFWHAERHGARRATAWGVAAFLFAAVVVPLYFLRYWLRARR